MCLPSITVHNRKSQPLCIQLLLCYKSILALRAFYIIFLLSDPHQGVTLPRTVDAAVENVEIDREKGGRKCTMEQKF